MLLRNNGTTIQFDFDAHTMRRACTDAAALAAHPLEQARVAQVHRRVCMCVWGSLTAEDDVPIGRLSIEVQRVCTCAASVSTVGCVVAAMRMALCRSGVYTMLLACVCFNAYR
jgi:hypothetical protein